MDKSPISREVIAKYGELMEEIKVRIACIDGVTKAEIGPLPIQIAEEVCYLQLRMICECIAVGCLLMHGNLKPKADLLKTHKADWIISELGKLHQDFYPEPLETKELTLPDGGAAWIPKKAGFLTKGELQTLWNRHCGYKLHRGSAKDIMDRKASDDFCDPILNWRIKIVKLLERHTISTPDRRWVCYVSMRSAQADGGVLCQVYRAQHDPPPK